VNQTGKENKDVSSAIQHSRAIGPALQMIEILVHVLTREQEDDDYQNSKN
jgi:hypothetical protein